MGAGESADSSRLRVCRSVAVLAAALVSVFELSSCATWLTPVPEATDHGLFAAPHPSATVEADARSPEERAADCRQRVHAARNPACFADDLGVVMDKQEIRRRQVLGRASEVVNLQASYNTLIYPFGAIAVYEKLRGAPNRNLLLPAVVGTAIYAMLGAGIPDRDKLYVQTGGELLCSLTWHGQWLYLDNDITGGPSNRTVETTTTREDQRGELRTTVVERRTDQQNVVAVESLEQEIKALTDSLSAFQKARGKLKLKGKPARQGAAGALERVKSPNVPQGKDTAALVAQRLAQQSAQARVTLQALRGLRQDIARAAQSLSEDGDQIMSDLQQRLGAKLPALTTPQAAAQALSDPNKNLAKAQAAEGAEALMDSVMPHDYLTGLDDASTLAVSELSSHTGVDLHSAWNRAQGWLDRQARREAQVRSAASGLPCSASTRTRMNETPRQTVASSTPPASAATGTSSGSAQSTGITTTPLPN